MIFHRIDPQFSVPFQYPVLFTEGVFNTNNRTLVDVMDGEGNSRRVLWVFDQGLSQTNPKLTAQAIAYSQHFGWELPSEPLAVPGGEGIKETPSVLELIYQKVADCAIDRHAYIVVAGGGAVLDAVGYAAATAHRGVRLVRLPSTVLAQNDAGIGVKNAVNYAGRKNFLGSFAPPYAVINDFDFLDTLDDRDRRAGLAEAVKVALIRDAEFFDVLEKEYLNLAAFESVSSRSMIQRCAELHLAHITGSGDPFERGSARPLDFGHWLAHKLEALTQHQLRHGEAVAIGIAVDTLYSHRIGLLPESAMNRVLSLLELLGFQLGHRVLAALDIDASLAEFREHLGGHLCISLLRDIGDALEVDEIDHALMQRCVDDIGQRPDSLVDARLAP